MSTGSSSNLEPELRVFLLLAAAAPIFLATAAGAYFWSFPVHPNIAQGIYGHVALYEGNCMPTTGPSTCQKSYVSRTIYVREPTAWDAMRDRYLVNPTPLVATGHSLSDGYYAIPLLPGNYSVFVEDRGGEYCNWLVAQDMALACYVSLGTEVRLMNLTVDHAGW